MAHLTIIAAIIAIWGGCALGLVAWGLLIRDGRDRRPLTTDEALDAFWVGLAATVAFLQVWHCVAPVGFRAAAVWAAIGGVGLCLHGRRLAELLHRARASRPRLACVLLLAAVWLANRATGPAELNDSGGYHVTGIRWANEHAIVPGLGNLLDMLSLNNAIFLCHALLEFGFWHGRSNHVVNGLLLAAFMGQACIGVARCLRPAGAVRPSDAYAATMVPLAVSMAVGPEVSSPGTDLGAALAGSVSVWCLVRLAQQATASQAIRRLLVAIAFTTALAITLKVSVLVVAGLVMATALLIVVMRTRPVAGTGWRAAVVAAIPWVVLLAPWALRGAVLSGYPVFPSTALAMPVPWRLDADYVRGIRDYVSACGFYWWLDFDLFHVPTMAPHRWLTLWLTKGVLREPLGFAVPIAVACGIAGCAVASARRPVRAGPGHVAPPDRTLLLVLVPIAGGIVFWATSAPSPRFGAWLLWALVGSIAAVAMRVTTVGRGPRLLAAGVCALGMVAIGHRTATWVHYHSATGIIPTIDPWTRSLWMPAGDDHGLHPYPVVTVVQRRSRWGVTVNTPAEGIRVWWAPLPASGCDITHLRLRTEGDLSKGFLTDRTPPAAPADDGPRNAHENP